MACRPPLWLWGLPALALIGGAAYYFKKDSIEADLTARGTAAIAAGEGAFSDGKPWGTLSISGRDALLSGTSPTTTATASLKARIDNVAGVRLVEDSASLLPEAKPFAWSISKTAAGFGLAGLVGAAGERGKILAAIGSVLPGVKIDDKMSLARGTPDCAMAGAATAATTLAQLITGEAKLADCTLSITGAAASQEIKSNIENSLKGLTGGLKLGTISLTAPALPPPVVVPPVVVAPPPVVVPAPVVSVPIDPAPVVIPAPPVVVTPPAPPPAPVVAVPPPPAPNYVKLCTDLMRSASSGNSPLFAFNKYDLDKNNLTIVEKLSVAMKQCHSSVKFEISGHTDSISNNDYNLVLSQNRVKTVTDTLVKLGLDGTKLMPSAKGQDMPIAPNTSAANMALNRRVEITPR